MTGGDSAALTAVNHKVVAQGETLPVVQLKDGTRVQTGTMAAVMHNIQLYNQGERGQVERDLEVAVPTLWKVGLFNLFTPDEFLARDNAGRALFGKFAKEYEKQVSNSSCTAEPQET